MAETYIGIGSNLGDKKANIGNALKSLEEKCKILDVSSLYETEPVGLREQDWFLNCVIRAETQLEPMELLEFLQTIEKKLKRVRKIKNGPRTIDMDILFYGDRVINEKELVVPHPRLHERLFVLVPLNEICPDLAHPLLNKSIKELTQELKSNKKLKLFL